MPSICFGDGRSLGRAGSFHQRWAPGSWKGPLEKPRKARPPERPVDFLGPPRGEPWWRPRERSAVCCSAVCCAPRKAQRSRSPCASAGSDDDDAFQGGGGHPPAVSTHAKRTPAACSAPSSAQVSACAHVRTRASARTRALHLHASCVCVPCLLVRCAIFLMRDACLGMCV